MKPFGNKKASIVPFEVSLSKRRMFLTGASGNSMITTANNDIRVKNRKPIRKVLLPISPEIVSNLGFKVLPDRRVCMAEVMLAGILVPRDWARGSITLKGLLAWYLPCMEIHRNTFRRNKKCFARRQYAFQKFFYSLRLY